MIADLIAIGLFSSGRYDVPPSRCFTLGLVRQLVPVPAKYPDELLPYHFDWTAPLESATIEQMTVATIGGKIVPTRAIFDNTTTSFWLGGGRSGFSTTISVLVTTNTGELIEQRISILCL